MQRRIWGHLRDFRMTTFRSFVAARSVLRESSRRPGRGYRSRTENAPGCPRNGLKNGCSANAKGRAGVYLGSFRNAQRALKKLQRGWSIIFVLSRMHRSGDRLSYASARSEVPVLVSAAEAYFWQLGKALYAAGIDRICISCITRANRDQAVETNQQHGRSKERPA